MMKPVKKKAARAAMHDAGGRDAKSREDGDGGRIYAVPALEKGLDILEFLATKSHPTTMTGIAQALGRSPGELFRLLSVLQRRGWLTRLNDDSYQLSTRLFELAHGFTPAKRLIDVALPVMRALAVAIRQSCHLSIADEGEQLVILDVETPGPAGLFVRTGTRYPLATTASGRVIMALSQNATPPGSVRTPTPEGAERNRPLDLEKRLTQIRKRGYEEIAGEWLEAVVDICWPIFNVRGEVTAVLAVPFLAMGQPRQDITTARERTRAAAEQISKAIGAGDYQRCLTKVTLRGGEAAAEDRTSPAPTKSG